MAANTTTARKTVTVEFTMEKETKGTFRYSEVTEGLNEPKIGALYIRKSALAEMGFKEAPAKLTVTVAA